MKTILRRKEDDFLSHYNFNPFQFTGSKRSVRTFNRRLLKYFKGRKAILDLGCGQGEFLELLREEGLIGFGVDSYDQSVEVCHKKGLRVEHADILEYIRTRRERVLEADAVSCTHVIEHMEPNAVFELFSELYSSTKPGTVLVITTPNIQDLEVVSFSFWLDLTHVRPYPGMLVKQMLLATGFQGVSFDAVYGLGINRHFLRRLLLDKVRFGNRILKPNLIVKAIR